ncbi:MAG: iron-containing redox enzyme family protein [Candidatus Obscuribacterales bacterium]|nr:iron-containing redox enzyme family protein [Candidatus Obscuribacterales bacterium]
MVELQYSAARLKAGRAATTDATNMSETARRIAAEHPCSSHPIFDYLDRTRLNHEQICGFLANYDAHASLLRRLLLKAATLMPEEAVGYILENVRNEYGNGNPDHRHQLQLFDLAARSGVSLEEIQKAPIHPGVQKYMQLVPQFYFPSVQIEDTTFMAPAISAGAITATEILAIEEFRHMQKSFAHLGLDQHIWFDHVTVEVEHSDESVALAVFFSDTQDGVASVLNGLERVLDANIHLYDGLLAAAGG